MSTPIQRRLLLRKPAPPGGTPSSTPSAPSAVPRPDAAARPEAVTDHALRFLRARAAQLERQVALASAEVRSRDALVADAVAALDGVRSLALNAGSARSAEEAQPLLRELDAFARSTLSRCLERGCAASQEETRWLVDFEPAAGNRFLTPAPSAGSWNSGERATVAGAASGEARALVQGALVASLEERLVSLAPALSSLAQQLGAEEALLAAQVDALARELAELAALSPTRGFLFGSAAQPGRAAPRPAAAAPKRAPPSRAAAPAAVPASAPAPARRPGLAAGRLPDLAGALASLPPFAAGRDSEGRDGVAALLRCAATAEAAWMAEREAMRAELEEARTRQRSSAAIAKEATPAALLAAAAPLGRVLDAAAAVERAPSEATLKGLVSAVSAERAALDAALQALSLR